MELPIIKNEKELKKDHLRYIDGDGFSFDDTDITSKDGVFAKAYKRSFISQTAGTKTARNLLAGSYRPTEYVNENSPKSFIRFGHKQKEKIKYLNDTEIIIKN